MRKEELIKELFEELEFEVKKGKRMGTYTSHPTFRRFVDNIDKIIKEFKPKILGE